MDRDTYDKTWKIDKIKRIVGKTPKACKMLFSESDKETTSNEVV